MAKLTIGNQTVTVDDAFLTMSPDQQASTVEEIAASLGGGSPQANTAPVTSSPPVTAPPGSREYADWAAKQARAGNALPQVSANPNSAQMNYDTALARTRASQFPDMTDQQWAEYSGSALAPYNPTEQGQAGSTLGFADEIGGITAGIGAAAREATGGGGTGFGPAFDAVQGLEEARYKLGQERNGILGGVAETAGSLSAFGPGKGLIDQAIARTTPIAQGLLKTAASSSLAGGVTGYAQGFGTTNGDIGERNQGGLIGGGVGATIGGAFPLVTSAVGGLAQKGADFLTDRAQTSLTNKAIQGAPAAADLKSAASKMFDASTGGQPLAINDNAFFRFLGNVKQYSDKLRINPENDPQATGLLSTLMRIADDTSQGVAVDLKDLHLVRQLAQKVSGAATGRDASLGREVVTQLDNLIGGLKPADILGGADPSAAASNLLKGISTWSRASKVGIIEEAIEKAGFYKSGMENGLRLQFQALLKNPTTRRLFTAAERTELEKVANGTAKTNLVTLLGKFGFGTNGATNMLGGTIGSSIGATVGSALGPAGSLIGAGLVGAGGTAARAASERMGINAANRAAQVIATPNIPTGRQFQIPTVVNNALNALGKSGAGAGVSATR